VDKRTASYRNSGFFVAVARSKEERRKGKRRETDSGIGEHDASQWRSFRRAEVPRECFTFAAIYGNLGYILDKSVSRDERRGACGTVVAFAKHPADLIPLLAPGGRKCTSRARERVSCVRWHTRLICGSAKPARAPAIFCTFDALRECTN